MMCRLELIVSCVILYLVTSGEALECYSCNDAIDSGDTRPCSTEYNGTEETCSSMYVDLCCVVARYENGDTTTFLRACVPGVSCVSGCESENGLETCMSVCYDDLCNTDNYGAVIKRSLVLLLSTSLLVMILTVMS